MLKMIANIIAMTTKQQLAAVITPDKMAMKPWAEHAIFPRSEVSYGLLHLWHRTNYKSEGAIVTHYFDLHNVFSLDKKYNHRDGQSDEVAYDDDVDQLCWKLCRKWVLGRDTVKAITRGMNVLATSLEVCRTPLTGWHRTLYWWSRWLTPQLPTLPVDTH